MNYGEKLHLEPSQEPEAHCQSGYSNPVYSIHKASKETGVARLR